MKHVRITLEQRDDDEYPAPLVIDLVLGEDRKPAHQIPFGGWWGTPHGTNWIRPLVFQPNGKVNWGGDPEEDDYEKFSRMPVHETEFIVGAKLYLQHLDEGTNVFIVKRIIDLADLKDVIW